MKRPEDYFPDWWTDEKPHTSITFTPDGLRYLIVMVQREAVACFADAAADSMVDLIHQFHKENEKK